MGLGAGKMWILGGSWEPSWSPKTEKLVPRAVLGRSNIILLTVFVGVKKVIEKVKFLGVRNF